MIKKNAIMRYKILDSLLSNTAIPRTMTNIVDRVNEKLIKSGMEPVTRRCIEKDLRTLEDEPYNAPIKRYYDGQEKLITYYEKGFSIFTKKLTDEEESLLAEVLNTIGQFEGLDNFEWLDGLKTRLNIKEHRRIIKFDTNPFLINQNYIGALFTAIMNRVVLSLHYRKFNWLVPREMIVHPYLLKQYNNRWFLIAGIKDDKIGNLLIGNFPLDRIDSFNQKHGIEYIEPDEDLESRFEDIVGVTLPRNKPIEKIVLWVSDESFPYIDTKPLHGSQTHITGKASEELREKYSFLSGGYFIKLQCVHNHELEQLLMFHMDGVVVLEPSSLSNSIKERVMRLAANYGGLTDK